MFEAWFEPCFLDFTMRAATLYFPRFFCSIFEIVGLYFYQKLFRNKTIRCTFSKMIHKLTVKIFVKRFDATTYFTQLKYPKFFSQRIS